MGATTGNLSTSYWSGTGPLFSDRR